MGEDQKKLAQWGQNIVKRGRRTRYSQEFRDLTVKLALSPGSIEKASQLSKVPKATIQVWINKRQKSRGLPQSASEILSTQEIKFQEVYLPSSPNDRIDLTMPNGISVAFMGDQALKLALISLLATGGR
jgi:hypothetical protein